MSVTRTEDTYSCDVCNKSGLAVDEVEYLVVSAYRHRGQGRGDTHNAEWRGDVCKSCLGSRRAPNPDPRFDNSVHVQYQDGNPGGILHRFAKWLFAMPVEECPHTREGNDAGN